MSFVNRIIIQDIADKIKTILNIIARPSWVNQSNGQVEVSTVTTVTGVSNITNMESIGSNSADGVIPSIERTNWGINIRSKIS
jgi:hypothetical protein